VGLRLRDTRLHGSPGLDQVDCHRLVAGLVGPLLLNETWAGIAFLAAVPPRGWRGSGGSRGAVPGLTTPPPRCDAAWLRPGGQAVGMTDERAGVCSFCGGPASGSGRARLLVRSKDGRAAVCGRCIESHAELLRGVEERRRRKDEGE
jgi:hypothetical protein